MRPLLLEMVGFGAFRDPVTIDFDDTEFFVLVGPTGSGKSTVIDAICFALYGNVPRYDDVRLVAPAITAGAMEAKVRLTFDLGGARYVVVRVVRRSAKGAVSTREARLERDDGTVLAGSAKELNAAVEHLLGLPFEHFTRSVVLPQGEFARFLHDKPAERQELLVRLLDLGAYERMAQRANAMARDLDKEVEFAERRLADLPRADDAAIAAAEATLGAVQGLVVELRDATRAAGAFERDRIEAQRETEGLIASLAALNAVAVPKAFRRSATELATARETASNADVAHGAALAAIELAEAAVAIHRPPAALREMLAIQERIGKGEAARADVAVQLTAAETYLAAANHQRDEAVQLERVASDAVVAVQRAHSAFALASVLEVGEPCPVCRNIVGRIVDHVPPPEVAEADEQAEVAGARTRTATAEVERASGERARLSGRLSAIDSTLEDLRNQIVQESPAADIEHLLTAAVAAEQELAGRRDDERRLRQAALVARRSVNESEQAVGAAEHLMRSQRDAVVALAPPAPTADLLASWEALAEWAGAKAVEQGARCSITAIRQRAIDGQLAALTTLAKDQAATLAVPGIDTRGATLDDIVRAVGRHEATSEAVVERLQATRLERTAIAATLDQHRDDASVARLLARLLASAGFPRWIISESLGELVTAASQTLRRLSGDQYSLDADPGGELAVIDHRAADERRPVRTLSGGETFQASLALALALADRLAGATNHTAALESIFLDEGFGTLDADSLETVANAIEQLGGTGRMVGIVTHVKELADRVPVRYEVTKGARTSTVERRVG